MRAIACSGERRRCGWRPKSCATPCWRFRASAIHIFLCGGLSHVDSFDYRPQLARLHGQPLPSGEKPDVFFGQVGLLRQPDWQFRQRGASGLWVSDLFPHLAEVADELTVIRSMTAETSNHTPATFQANTGFRLNGFPVLGSWLSFGLGCENDELPAYVVIPDVRGVPAGGSINWSNGFLPARHQGVTIRSRGPAIHDLSPARPIAAHTEAASRHLLAAMNSDTWPTMPAAMHCWPASAVTKWRPACNWPCPKSPISIEKPDAPTSCMESAASPPTTSAVPA